MTAVILSLGSSLWPFAALPFLALLLSNVIWARRLLIALLLALLAALLPLPLRMFHYGDGFVLRLTLLLALGGGAAGIWLRPRLSRQALAWRDDPVIAGLGEAFGAAFAAMILATYLGWLALAPTLIALAFLPGKPRATQRTIAVFAFYGALWAIGGGGLGGGYRGGADGQIARLLLSAMGILLFCLLLMPRRGYPWVVAVFAPLCAFILWTIGRPTSSSDDWAAWGAAFAIAWLVVALLAAGVRWLIDLGRGARNPLPPIDWTPAWVGIAITFTVALSWVFAPTLARLVGGWGAMSIGAITAATLAWLGWQAAGRSRWITGAIAATLFAGMAYVLSWPAVVGRAAEDAALGRPYCIMIGDGGRGFRTATSPIDLSPILMRATEYPQLRNQHAVLIIDGAAPRNFSYRKGRFADVARNGPDRDEPLCKPARRWAAKL